MPSTSSFSSSGGLQYIIKPPFTSTIPSGPSTNPFTNLLACGIVTDVQGVSFNVVLNGRVIGHFENDQIVSWEVNSNTITIKTKDQVSYLLSFLFVTEALNADIRINSNMNGVKTTGC